MFQLTDNKIPPKWARKGLGLNFEFWDPLPKFGTGKPRDLKFFLALPATELGRGSQNLKIRPKIPTALLLEYFVIHDMENTKICPYTKFELFSFTRSKFREGSQNSKFWPPDPHENEN